MKITCMKEQKTFELKKGDLVRRSDFEEMVNALMDGVVFMVGNDNQEISIKDYVAMSLLHNSEKELVEFLCGKTGKLEDINNKMRKQLSDDLYMAFVDHDIIVESAD